MSFAFSGLLILESDARSGDPEDLELVLGREVALMSEFPSGEVGGVGKEGGS